jgi:endonuclease YncB( thermonuclease family)
VQEHFGELTQAKEPAAHAASERLVRALEEIEAAVWEWQAVAQHYAGLLSVVDGVDGRDVPDLYVDAVRLESAARARERGIPTPSLDRSRRSRRTQPCGVRREALYVPPERG